MPTKNIISAKFNSLMENVKKEKEISAEMVDCCPMCKRVLQRIMLVGNRECFYCAADKVVIPIKSE